MFCLAALVPSPPILVPELCGGLGAGAAVDEVRAAASAAAAELAAAASSWTVVGVGAGDRVAGPERAGTFRGFGVDLVVGLSGSAPTGDLDADPDLPLPVLIAAWLRQQVAPHAVAQAWIVDADTPAGECAELGAKLRAELDADPQPQGVLVVADGATTLSTAAPGYFDPRAADRQAALDNALRAGDRDGLLALDPLECAEVGIRGRAAFQVLAGVFGADPAAPIVDTRYQDAPFGVGYQVSTWRPRTGDRR
ncbi:hypothetical protein [Nocardia cyriacigeorgica]|uniref:hypothetical protein n=1 Tax=Nocardia cyriacigeorgica TaxID=135487 RepID=UPI0013D01934|nr:hypothetical protein [Nocardia cyriacigeorgica]MBF6435990.1 hypothetical protein [Nocardia cyriacigeorgica]MBF6453933.1 hypothetical protein [Nocardia cyriacigeorgica]MBF6481126.1 hypothetical protein [Nocardia cyriacigeorgica]MBF6551827.1 hypothetical protein [Nocardia cyriacigeorgica]NEW26557.1 hypothetical protein [Nocardia cyriacigeorgica]